MLATHRQRALRLLHAARPGDFALCREVEAGCHAAASTATDYGDRVRRAAFNLRENPRAAADVVHTSDAALAEGTLRGRILAERATREARFERMLQEKYDALGDGAFNAIVRCRRCGSTDVSWDEKQTRSADEAASLFCVCATCRNRWVVR
jgi:DNA-directed RNA polymerase subunit M/transcription elongation factor TFIIS